VAIPPERLVHVSDHNGGVVHPKQVHGRPSSPRRSSSANPASIADSAP
jgi:hypothetical protein